MWYGNTKIIKAITHEIKFGIMAYFGSPSGKKLDQVKFPSEKAIGPKSMNWSIALSIMLPPGTGRLYRLKTLYFWTQNIKPIPGIAKRMIIGCREEKKQQKR